MFEKVNPKHPDKIADRIAGAIVDLAYRDYEDPRIAVEVLIGHGHCHVIIETNVVLKTPEIESIIARIGGDVRPNVKVYTQDQHLQKNQADGLKAGDNGIFKGVPMAEDERMLTSLAKTLYRRFRADGKYIVDGDRLIICQSNASTEDILNDLRNFASYKLIEQHFDLVINPLGDWTGGTNVDTGCTNRKLGSDMAQSITGGGLHGKDFSKADVSVNIYAFYKAQETGKVVEISCAIGDSMIDGKPYSEIVALAKEYIESIGGFEAFAEWGYF